MSKKKRFDWKAVRAKLRALQAGTGPEQGKADVAAVYRQRAVELAERREQTGVARGRSPSWRSRWERSIMPSPWQSWPECCP